MVNTILTDDERREIHRKAALAPSPVDTLIDETEAAVLAKLRERDKRWADRAAHLLNVFDAAPQPAVVPPEYKLVPVELLRRASKSLGDFVSDQGWAQEDMDTMDSIDAMLAAAPEAPAQGRAQIAEQAERLSDDEIMRQWERKDEVLQGRAAVLWFARAVINAHLLVAPEAPALPAEVREVTTKEDHVLRRAAALSAKRISHPLPTDVREAIKVAREALRMLQDGSTQMENGIWGSIRMPSDAAMNAGKAALARLDALGGGE